MVFRRLVKLYGEGGIYVRGARFGRALLEEGGKWHTPNINRNLHAVNFILLLLLLLSILLNLYLNIFSQSRQVCGAAAYKCFFVTANLGGCIIFFVVVSSNSGAFRSGARGCVAIIIFLFVPRRLEEERRSEWGRESSRRRGWCPSLQGTTTTELGQGA